MLAAALQTTSLLFFCPPDVPEVVYSCHPEAAAGSRPPVPTARHGGWVHRFHFSYLCQVAASVWTFCSLLSVDDDPSFQ